MWGYALKDGEAPTNPSRSKKLRHVATFTFPRFFNILAESVDKNLTGKLKEPPLK